MRSFNALFVGALLAGSALVAAAPASAQAVRNLSNLQTGNITIGNNSGVNNNNFGNLSPINSASVSGAKIEGTTRVSSTISRGVQNADINNTTGVITAGNGQGYVGGNSQITSIGARGQSEFASRIDVNGTLTPAGVTGAVSGVGFGAVNSASNIAMTGSSTTLLVGVPAGQRSASASNTISAEGVAIGASALGSVGLQRAGN